MLDAQFIVKTLLEPEKLNLGFVFKKLLPSEEFREHNALEDTKAMYRVFEEVKTISSLDNVGMTKLCPAFDPTRDRVGKVFPHKFYSKTNNLYDIESNKVVYMRGIYRK